MGRSGSGLAVLVLAAGKGTRLRSNTIKLLHGVAGRPMVCWVVDAAAALRPRSVITVVGHQAERVKEALDGAGPFVLQSQQLGTGHAVLQASRAIRATQADTLLILNGDLPTLRPSTLKRFVARHRRSGAALTLLTTELPDATGYGRILRDGNRITGIVEEKDATPEQRRVREGNMGIYCADPGKLLTVLRRLRPDNAQGEYYITDAAHLFLERGERVEAVLHPDAAELLGVNTRQELAASARTLYARKAEELQDSGVTLLHAERTRVDPRAKIGRDTIIHPDVLIEGPCVIGEDCLIRSGTRITDSRLGSRVRVRDHCVVTKSRVGSGVQIGPFAHIRPDSELQDDSRVGNFVELKKTRLGRGAKASHLTYLGDAEVGAESNIGAGTITCNYDGTHKHRTRLARKVFIGSNSALVAPIEVGAGAYVAAGSTVTENVPAGALAVARGHQRNVKGWVARKKRGKGRRDKK